MLSIVEARSEEQFDAVRALFSEYAAYLGFDLGFQGFEDELAGFPGDYAPPGGRLLLATWDDAPAGCVALRPIASADCEMKRLFIRSQFRGRRIGLALANRIISEARAVGYSRMMLDTVPALKEAIGLYRSLGFVEIAPYRYNPIEGATYWALDLGDPRSAADEV